MTVINETHLVWAEFLKTHRFTIRDIEQILTIPGCYSSREVWISIMQYQVVPEWFMLRHREVLHKFELIV